MPSLRDFTALETVIIQHALVPPSLQLLSPRDRLQHRQGYAKGLYPNLVEFKILAIDRTRPIKLAGQKVPPGTPPVEMFMSLKDLFKGTKVDFEIDPHKMPDYGDSDDSDVENDGPSPLGPFPGPPGFEQLVQMAMQNPNFAAMLGAAGRNEDDSDNSWETDDEN
ncbi:hypothetical protein BJX99DRAFT_264530 [Aspergillus californicus]